MSDTPRNVWWEVLVYTAAHVVFDADEAKHTSVRLFYDTPDCPGVVLDKVSVDDVSIERDWCILKCVTCDEILGERLTASLNKFEALTPKVLKYYRKSGLQEKLTFMISHPHGCPKKVSFGATVDRYQIGLYRYTKLTYTTSSCPGSSGAAVCCIEGQGSDFVLRHVIHSGCLDRSLNVSGAGVM
ncbi:hypothetical protein BgiBS90_028234 [Biomphalaria glabrata]|nr:hypothetical protein BgiBS90_028234 [Biomphalaria glabrata]